MILVEKSGHWGRLLRAFYRQEVEIDEISPAQLSAQKLSKARLIAVEFGPTCLDSWISLFDKTGFRLENNITALLNAPRDSKRRSWCREMGFQFFADDVESLVEWTEFWKNEITSVQHFGNFADEIVRRLPWSETDHE